MSVVTASILSDAAKIDAIYELLGELREEGTTMLLVEQNVVRTIDFCDRCLVLSSGRVRAEGSREELRGDTDLVRAYLGGRVERQTSNGGMGR